MSVSLKKILVTNFPLAIVFVASLAILTVKTGYLFKDYRFMPFGFDSPRIIGYTQQLLQFKTLDPDASYRYGLPLFAGFFVTVLSLPPSQTFVIPLWVINVGGGLLPALTAWYLTRDKKIAVLCSALYASYAEGALVNDSYFMNLIVAPLRLLFLFIFTNPSLLKNWQKWLTLLIYGFLVGYGSLTYPIISLPLDIITIGYIFYLFMQGMYLRRRSILIILIQLLAYALVFGIYRQGIGHPIPINKYFEYIYALNFLKLDHWLVAKIVLSFLAFEVLVIVSLILNLKILQKSQVSAFKLSFVKPVVFRIWQDLNKVLIGIGIAVLFLSGINELAAPLDIFSGFLSLPGISLLSDWWIIALLLGVSKGGKRDVGKKQLPFQFMFFILSGYILLYSFFPGETIVKIVRNKRLVVFFLPYIFIIFSVGLVRLKRPLLITLSSLFIILPLVRSWREIKRYFQFPARQDTLEAMDWFSRQPDHTNVLFYATYSNSPNLTGHEKYYGLYFNSSKIPYKDQRLLGKCVESEEVCAQNYLDYINNNQVKYLVLEYGQGSYIFERLSGLGEVIYDSGVRIVRM